MIGNIVSALSGCGEGLSQEHPQSCGGAGMRPRPPAGPGREPGSDPQLLGGHGASPLLGPASSLSTPPEVFLEGAGWRNRGREQDLGCPRQRTLRMRRGPAERPFCPAPPHSPLPPPGPPALNPGAGPGPEAPLLPSTRGPQEAASPAGGGVGGGAMRGLSPDSKTPTGRPSGSHRPATALEGAPSAGSTPALSETQQLGPADRQVGSGPHSVTAQWLGQNQVCTGVF